MRTANRPWVLYLARYLEHCFRTRSVPRVDELAMLLKISREHLTRSVRKHTGRSPGVMLRRMQLKQAKALLATTNRSTADIARACGYGSLRAFYRAFLHATGVTPSTYRRNVRKRMR